MNVIGEIYKRYQYVAAENVMSAAIKAFQDLEEKAKRFAWRGFIVYKIEMREDMQNG
jgi:hypothetical protein